MKVSPRDAVGAIRVTCPEPLVPRLMQAGILERFYARYPGLRVEFVMSDTYLDLAKGEADIALRSGDTDDELIGRKIGDSYWAVYASRAYVAQHGAPRRPEELAEHALIGFDEAMTNHRAAQWLRQVAPTGRIVARNHSVLGLALAVKSGIGIAPLPKPIGDADGDLICVLGPIPELTRIWRVLAHPDARRTPRVAAFFDFLIEEIETLRPILTG
jgi:DNA-binding transcriptional LysR family regulator